LRHVAAGGVEHLLRTLRVPLHGCAPLCSDERGDLYFACESYAPIEQLLRAQSAQLQRTLLQATDCIPKTTIGALRLLDAAADAAAAAVRWASLPAALRAALLDFQVQGVHYSLARGGRVLIADEMGVGKTLQAVAVACCYADEWPLLIVVPATLRVHWADELQRWATWLRPADVHVIFGAADKLSAKCVPKVTIISYTMLEHLRGDMSGLNFKVVIVDESHKLRTPSQILGANSKETDAALHFVRKASRAILLSGTPMISRPYDVFNQVDALRPGMLGSAADFGANYCDARRR
jgi:SNF2 family DNA or RNA helicase